MNKNVLFVCDIGNTRIKGGIFKNNTLTGFKVFDSINSIIPFLLKKKINKAAVSSVVPKQLNYFIKRFRDELNLSPVVINKDSNFNLKIEYDTPDTLGIDRICSAEGAFYLYKQNLKDSIYNRKTFIISIDLGTATTINIIKYKGIFTGGIISPGIELMFNSLKNKTAQLPLVKASDYKNFIGSSTKSSIASGVLNSAAGLINRTINYIKERDKKSRLVIYVTGGNAETLFPFFNFDYTYEKGLVLYGIKTIYDNTIRKV